MIKLLAYLVIAGLSVGLFYLSYLYITGKKFVKAIPRAHFSGGPLDGKDYIIGPFKDFVWLLIPNPAQMDVYAVYMHYDNGFYGYQETIWDDEEIDLDNGTVLSYNDLTSEQEDTDDTDSDNSREPGSRPRNLG